MHEISASQLAARLAAGDVPVLVDVRESWEWTLGHLPDALHIPLGQLPARWHELNTHAETVVICHHGVRSAQAVRFLEHQGFSNMVNLHGGMDAWSDIDPTTPRY
jgi:rhodanese-related sulfurtransferase